MIDWLRTKLPTFKTNVESARAKLAASEDHLRMMETSLKQAREQMWVAQQGLDEMSIDVDDIVDVAPQLGKHLIGRQEYDQVREALAAKGQELDAATQKLDHVQAQLKNVMQDRDHHVKLNKELTKDLAARIITMLDDLSALPTRNGSTPAARAPDGRGGEWDEREVSFLAASQQTLRNSLLALLASTCDLQPIPIKPLEPYNPNLMSQGVVAPSSDDSRHRRGRVAEIIKEGYIERKSGRVFRLADVSVFE